ncbi:F-box only protein 25 isoform X2 [Hyla sarda]|uniref:F-box only protein 25 isoform X2 n=1 Tax=Hyla sarda TaxID=327740 RepID=UPI0024C41F0D|nr:F-box only protein 25 isoform X2 [Hyla sarda]
MPFLGQDWRSPGWSWMKTEDGWKRCEYPSDDLEGNNNINLHLLNINDGEMYENENCCIPPTKSEKEQFNNTTKSQCNNNFYQEKWIYVHKESTRERHGYCTLGEAFNRLDFSSAIQDIRRFNYVAKLLQLIAKSQLTSLSGAAQKNYFNILETIVKKVLQDQYNPQLIRDLLHDLGSTLGMLVREADRCLLIGNTNIWISRLETILLWQEQLMNLQISPKLGDGPTLCDLPQQMKSNILFRLTDSWDIINLGQMTPSWHILSEDLHLWKVLCKYHFSEKMFCKDLIFTENGHIDWKLMFFTLEKYYPKREQYGDTLHFCRHCSILFWKDSGHPCTANDPRSCLTPVSPQHFIDLFRF